MVLLVRRPPAFFSLAKMEKRRHPPLLILTPHWRSCLPEPEMILLWDSRGITPGSVSGANVFSRTVRARTPLRRVKSIYFTAAATALRNRSFASTPQPWGSAARPRRASLHRETSLGDVPERRVVLWVHWARGSHGGNVELEGSS